MARSQVASDTFDSSISGSWDNGPGDFGTFTWVTGGHLEATDDATQAAMRYSGAAFAADQYAVVTVHDGSGSPGIVGAMVRMQGGTDESSYAGRIRTVSGSKYVIREWDSAFAATDLASTGTPPTTLTAGWTVALEVIGTNLELFTDEGSGEVSRTSVSDATVADGETGILLFNAVGAVAQATAWVGGDITGADPEPSLVGGKLVRNSLLLKHLVA